MAAAAVAEIERPWVMLTGGAGYIGSHTALELLEAGYNVTITDNLSNSSDKVLARILEVSRAEAERIEFVTVDLRDEAALAAVFGTHTYAGVVHFAAFKAVGESRLKPITYFDNNLVACISLMKVMGAAGCKTLIFSSSCTVYGESPPPLAEDAPTGAGITNAYGRSKFIMEQMLQDVHNADALDGHELPKGGPWRICVLRYFNPVGAHPSGRLGEDPRGIPNCLMPYVLQTLVGRRKHLTIYGDDYPTADGTCVRDYIHVCDVASGHVDALRWIKEQPSGPLLETFNFGTGKGTSVLELVAALEKAAGKECPKTIGARRPGDLPETFCDPRKAKEVLGWVAKYDIDAICEHAWRWQSENPAGYDSEADT